MSIGNKGPFPETGSAHEGFEDNGFIKKSDSLLGHQDGDHLGPFEWPNKESGEGKDGTGHAIGQPSWLNE